MPAGMNEDDYDDIEELMGAKEPENSWFEPQKSMRGKGLLVPSAGIGGPLFDEVYIEPNNVRHVGNMLMRSRDARSLYPEREPQVITPRPITGHREDRRDDPRRRPNRPS